MWNGKMKALTFSYDDGVTTDERLIAILNQYGMKGTFNLNMGRHTHEGQPRWVRRAKSGWGYITRFTYEEMPEIYKGHEVALHSYTHPHLENLSREDCTREIAEDFAGMEQVFGIRADGMAYPFGTYNDDVVDVLRSQGVKYCRTTKSTYNFDTQTDLLRFHPTCHHRDGRLMELAKAFVEMKPDKPQLFYVWGHTYEFEDSDNWDIIERFCEFMANRDDIFYGTNAEVLL